MASNNFKDQKSIMVSDYGKTSEQRGNLHHPDNYDSIEKTYFCFADIYQFFFIEIAVNDLRNGILK